jgi:dTDP-4-dehydrorhamnose reductase
MARIIEMLLVEHDDLSGLWQVASDPISKYDLLHLAKDAFDWRGTIVADEDFVCDRSLNSQRFRAQTGFVPPTWSEMIEELAKSPR